MTEDEEEKCREYGEGVEEGGREEEEENNRRRRREW